ncbi:MAG: hypothetical protein ACI90U_003187 [Pseudomonadales bacterium]
MQSFQYKTLPLLKRLNIRKAVIKNLILVFILSFIAVNAAVADNISEQTDQEIKALLQAVADSGCEFTRNGSQHSAQDAGEHLALKYRRGKKYVSDAESFIERLATKSSWSGEIYMMQCSGSEAQTARVWLIAKLTDIRENA